ncbi:amino acid--tRNA ligase-related protein, partial [Luteibacter sp.]
MRTHFCGLIDESLIGQEVTLCGWVNTLRLQSHVAFVDLRDHEGIAQVVIERENAVAFAVAGDLGNEFVIRVTGQIRQRLSPNDKLRTGTVELLADSVEILNEARDLPFAQHETPNEDMRMTYRYLDLRRPEMQQMMRTRTALVRELRRYLDTAGFQDIETPILTKATPEGARDYLVPSRVHPGQFYALPQSPQLFKQILMMAGFDRYYQIARCFRDEDLRADRQPE